MKNPTTFRRGTITGSISVQFDDGTHFDLDLTYDAELAISHTKIPNKTSILDLIGDSRRNVYDEQLSILQIESKNQRLDHPIFTIRVEGEL